MNNYFSTAVGAQIDSTLSSLPIGYSVVKAVYKKLNYNEILKSKFLEFIEFLEKNEKFFKDELFKNEHFVYGLAITYSEITKQRFRWKRDRIFGVFLGFVKETDKEDFELEKIYNILNLMSLEDLDILNNFQLDTLKKTSFDEKDKYLFLKSSGIIIGRLTWEQGEHYELTSFGKKFKEIIFQTNSANVLLTD